MSTYTEVMRQREQIRRIVALHKGGNPRLFGSVAQGRQASGSDIDLLVDALPGATLMDIVRMEQQLRHELGLNFDVNTPPGLPPAWRSQVLREAVAL